MSVPALPTKVHAIYNVLTGAWSEVDEAMAKHWQSMIDDGLLGAVVYEGEISWTQHGPNGSEPFTPPAPVPEVRDRG